MQHRNRDRAPIAAHTSGGGNMAQVANSVACRLDLLRPKFFAIGVRWSLAEHGVEEVLAQLGMRFFRHLNGATLGGCFITACECEFASSRLASAAALVTPQGARLRPTLFLHHTGATVGRGFTAEHRCPGSLAPVRFAPHVDGGMFASQLLVHQNGAVVGRDIPAVVCDNSPLRLVVSSSAEIAAK